MKMKGKMNEIKTNGLKRTPEFFEICGNLLGDGGYKSGKIYYSNKDLDLINRFKYVFRKQFGMALKEKRNKSGCYTIMKSFRKLSDFFREQKKRIKKLITEQNKSKKKK